MKLDALKHRKAGTVAELATLLPANLPAPEITAADLTADLEAAMEQFATIAEDLKK